MKNNFSFKDIYQIIGDFREENNIRFDKIEAIFNKHCDEQNAMVEKYIKERAVYQKEIDIRIKPLEKLADRVLFVILLVSGVFALVWQIAVGFIKKEFKI